MGHVAEMRVVVAVLEVQNFTAAGRRFGLTGSATAKMVGRVEERLGVNLVTRTTRRLTLTPEGETYLFRMRRVLADIDEAEEEISSSRSSPRGPLRVTIPNFVFVRLLAHALPDFMERFPKVQLHLNVTDRRVDIVGDSVDVAIRLGSLADSALHARKICDLHRGLYASPRYIERHGTPRTPEDLLQHECLFSNQAPGLDLWPFTGPSGVRHIKVNSRIVLNDALGVFEAAVSGLGIGQFSDLHVAPGLRDGRLIPVLADQYDPAPVPMWLLTPPGRQRAARVAAFMQFCLDRFGSAPWREALAASPGRRVLAAPLQSKQAGPVG